MTTADSTSLMTSPPAAVVDSATKAKLTVPATKQKATGVERDSAYGPTFTIDSTGKMIPIPTKKP